MANGGWLGWIYGWEFEFTDSRGPGAAQQSVRLARSARNGKAAIFVWWALKNNNTTSTNNSNDNNENDNSDKSNHWFQCFGHAGVASRV